MGTARRRSPLPFHASAAQVGVCQFSAYVRVEVPFAGTLLEDGGDESDGAGGGESADDELEGDGAGVAPRAPTVAPSFDLDAFSATVRGIQRINGATYISTALRCGFFALCINLPTGSSFSCDFGTPAAKPRRCSPRRSATPRGGAWCC